MKLAQLFSGEVRSENTGRTQSAYAHTEGVNRQARSFTPGQTVSGEIISKNGSEVQIRLSDDTVLNARVDRNLNIEVGKSMTFEVKNNGSALTLSPLFTNVSADINVLKALDMAGLPVNETSVGMTKQLMEAGMPVNRSILQQIYREINSFPQGTVSDIVNLHKMQMPVNEANVNQMVSYGNLTHHLAEGMDAILGELPELFRSMAQEGDFQGAVRLYQDIFLLLEEGGEGQAGPGQGIIPQAPVGEATAGGFTALESGGREGLLSGPGGDKGEAAAPPGTAPADTPKEVIQDAPLRDGEGTRGMGRADSIPQAMREALAREVLELADGISPASGTAFDIRGQMTQFIQGQGDLGQLFSAMGLLGEAAGKSPQGAQALAKLLSGRPFQELLAGRLKENWTLRPEELALPGKVEELYKKLDRQLKSLSGVLESAGQNESAAFRAAASMSQNVDFMQQINQMYAYVQLPLKMQQREAHGELYVYANKRNLAGRDGKISALLHLDMEHLGPVDVYVALQSNKVNTRFYLRDEEMIDFIAGHMDILTRRLRDRGYDCSFAMTIRGEGDQEATEGGLQPILNREKGVMLSQYAFDVRT